MAVKCYIYKCNQEFQDQAALYIHQHSIHYCSHNDCSGKFPDSASRQKHLEHPHKRIKAGKTLNISI